MMTFHPLKQEKRLSHFFMDTHLPQYGSAYGAANICWVKRLYHTQCKDNGCLHAVGDVSSGERANGNPGHILDTCAAVHHGDASYGICE